MKIKSYGRNIKTCAHTEQKLWLVRWRVSQRG